MTQIAKHTFALMAALVITVLTFDQAVTVPLASPGAVAPAFA